MEAILILFIEFIVEIITCVEVLRLTGISFLSIKFMFIIIFNEKENDKCIVVIKILVILAHNGNIIEL